MSTSAWDLPWQERAEINQFYADVYAEMSEEEKQMVADEERIGSWMELVEAFHRKHGILKDPDIANRTTSELRVALIDEEADELFTALGKRDKVAVADALGDLLYVVLGAADVYGIDIDRVFREVHRSNMTKVSEGDQNIKIHKIRKGPEYSPPDLSFVLEQEGK